MVVGAWCHVEGTEEQAVIISHVTRHDGRDLGVSIADRTRMPCASCDEASGSAAAGTLGSHGIQRSLHGTCAP
eukprot:5751856-Prymnesium_polylepis.1